MRRTANEEHELAMVRAAELYYMDGFLQSEVADKLRLTRWKVGRLLAEAREIGLVQIRIDHPLSRRRDLEEALQEKFAGTDFVVVSSQEDPTRTLDFVSNHVASMLEERRPLPQVMAFSWGRTISRVVASFSHGVFRHPVLVQLNGGAHSIDRTVDAASILKVVAEKSANAKTRLLLAPAIVQDENLAEHLRKSRNIVRTLEAARNSDVAVFSLGALSQYSVLVESGVITIQEQEQLSRQGAVGDVLGRFINLAGEIVDPAVDDRTIGLTLDEIRELNTSIAVSVGESKSEITSAVLNAGLCTTLVTESAIAEKILSM